MLREEEHEAGDAENSESLGGSGEVCCYKGDDKEGHEAEDSRRLGEHGLDDVHGKRWRTVGFYTASKL